MQATLRKAILEALPANEFVQVWECVEAIDAAVEKAGIVGPFALTYVAARNAERKQAELATERVFDLAKQLKTLSR